MKFEFMTIVMIYNAELRGLCNYYAIASNFNKLVYFGYLMEYSCLKTLANKHRSRISKVRYEYRDGTGAWGVPYETKKGKRRMMFAKYSDCKGKDLTEKVPDLAYRYSHNTTSFEERLKAKVCEVCGCTDSDSYEMQMKIKKLGALLVSVALCAGMAAPAFAYGGEPVEEVEQPVLTSTTDEEDVVTVTDEETGALTPEGNLTLVDDYHTDYSDGSGQQFITLVSKSGATFYLVIDRNAKGQQTVHFMNLVDEADLLSLMEEEEANAYTAEKEAAAQAEQDRLKAEEEAKKAAEEAAASGTEQPKENKVTKIASGFLGVVVLIALAAGGGFYFYHQQMQKKKAEKEALDPDANYTEDKGDFEIPTDVPDEDEAPDEQDTEPI